MEIILRKPGKEYNDNAYLYLLTKQYRESLGYKKAPIDDKEFKDWLKEREETSKIYLLLLEYMKIDYNHPLTAEIGKGLYDSIVLNDNTSIITPFTNGIVKPNTTKAIFEVVTNSKAERSLKQPTFDSIMTQNPYNGVNIRNWEYLFNQEMLIATIGIFGKTYDADAKAKLKMIEEFKQRLSTTPYKEDGFTFKDDYGYVISSASKFKKRVKTRG